MCTTTSKPVLSICPAPLINFCSASHTNAAKSLTITAAEADVALMISPTSDASTQAGVGDKSLL